MHYFVFILTLQSSSRGRESWLLCYYCLTDVLLLTINVLRLLLTVPWVGLQYVIGVFPDHTHLLFACWVILHAFFCQLLTFRNFF